MPKLVSRSKQKLSLERGEDNPFSSSQPILNEHINGNFRSLERRFLAGLLENAHHCIRPTNEVLSKKSGSYYRPENVYLASISLSLRYVKDRRELSHYEFVDNTPWRHLTYSDNTDIKSFEEIVLGSVNKSISDCAKLREEKSGPLIIAVNEFGFPFYRQDELRNSFLGKLKDISLTHNAYVVCGTSHCFRSKKNLAILSYPTDLSGEIIEHAKYSPAINLGEKLQPRDSLEWKFYSTEIGRIGILVCFDVVDPIVILRQMYFARDMQEDNRINLFIIPTFSANDRVRDQAEMLSYLTKSIVLYVNCQYLDSQDVNGDQWEMPSATKPRARSHGLFVGGEDVTSRVSSNAIFGSYVEILAESVFDYGPSKNDHWSSMRLYRLSYRNLIRDLYKRNEEFSPLLREILSLAADDPISRQG